MKRLRGLVWVLLAALLVSGCVTPSGKGSKGSREGGAGKRGSLGASAGKRGSLAAGVGELIEQLSSRTQREGKAVSLKLRIRFLAEGYLQLICTEDPGSRILLYLYFDGGGSLLEGAYFCYTKESPPKEGKDAEAAAVAPVSMIWSKSAPLGEDAPAEFERYDFRRGVLIKAEMYRRGEAAPYRIYERDEFGIEKRIVSREGGGIEQEEVIGEEGYPVLRKMFKDGDYVRSQHLDGPFSDLVAERVEAGVRISGTLLPNYRYFRAARFEFLLAVDNDWNVINLSGQEESARFRYSSVHNDAAAAADAIEECFGWSVKDFVAAVKASLEKRHKVE